MHLLYTLTDQYLCVTGRFTKSEKMGDKYGKDIMKKSVSTRDAPFFIYNKHHKKKALSFLSSAISV